MNSLPHSTPCGRMRFDLDDPRFARVQELFEKRKPEAARTLLRALLREWLRRQTTQERNVS